MIIPHQTVALLMKFISTKHYHVAVDGLQMPQNMYTHTHALSYSVLVCIHVAGSVDHWRKISNY